jgi:hypothetical protein
MPILSPVGAQVAGEIFGGADDKFALPPDHKLPG